jgi:hypothetical protein
MLPQEAPGYILEGFTQCLVVEFRDICKLLATTNKVRQMRAVSGRHDSTTTLAAVHKLCSKANEVFHSLNLTNKWNIPQSHQAAAFVTFFTIAAHLTITVVINVLFHVMKQKPQRPNWHAPSILLKGMLLVVVVVDADMVVVKVAVRMTVPTLGANGGLKVVQLLLLQIHLQVMELRKEMDHGWLTASCVDGMTLIHLSTVASGIEISLLLIFLQPMCSGASWAKHLCWEGPTSATAAASSGVSRGQLSELINCYKTETEDGTLHPSSMNLKVC